MVPQLLQHVLPLPSPDAIVSNTELEGGAVLDSFETLADILSSVAENYTESAEDGAKRGSVGHSLVQVALLLTQASMRVSRLRMCEEEEGIAVLGQAIARLKPATATSSSSSGTEWMLHPAGWATPGERDCSSISVARLTRHTRHSFPTDGGHTIMLAFERQAVDSWAITTINTGEGCNSYHMQLGGDERYKTKIKAAVRIEGVPASRILHPLALWLLLRLNDASRPSHQHKPSVYDRNSIKFGQWLGTNGEPHAIQQTGFTKSSSHSSPAATCATLYKPRAPTLAPTGSLRNELEHATTAVC